jgi:hypothetical protein
MSAQPRWIHPAPTASARAEAFSEEAEMAVFESPEQATREHPNMTIMDA